MLHKISISGASFLILVAIPAYADSSNVYVHRHITKSGTIVQQHYRTHPDHSRQNNWSSKGQANPYTGKKGTKNPY
jgi:hypothetical protein